MVVRDILDQVDPRAKEEGTRRENGPKAKSLILLTGEQSSQHQLNEVDKVQAKMRSNLLEKVQIRRFLRNTQTAHNAGIVWQLGECGAAVYMC